MTDPIGVKARSGQPRKTGPTGGRPDILTDAMTADICGVLVVGSTVRTACALSGVSIDSFYRWAKKGARDKRKGRGTRYSRFSDAIKRAMGQATLGYEAVVAEAAKGSPPLPEIRRGDKIVQHARPALLPNWQAAMTWLERRHPEDYARRTYRIEDVGVTTPAGPSGLVVPYEVRLPLADPIPSRSAGDLAPPPQETARSNGPNEDPVKRKQQDSDGAGS